MNLPFGLGDLAHYLFRPLVYLIDWIWKTDLRDCTKCKRRRKQWNALFSVPRWAAIFLVTVSILLILWGSEP